MSAVLSICVLTLKIIHLNAVPNIIFILMDDLGWNDVSYNGGQFPTPNIDNLKSHSIELTKHYIHLMCSPSRTQILTGRYAMRQGLGRMVPWDYTEIGGIPIGQPTIATWLKATGDWTNYAIGKWHCGYAYHELIPTYRGFDHFFGFYQGAIDYETLEYFDLEFGHTIHYDFWNDENPYIIDDFEHEKDIINTMYLYENKVIEYIEIEGNKLKNTYEDTPPFFMYISLQTMHATLLTIEEYKQECDNISIERSIYCQNTLLSDHIIGTFIQTLKDNNMWDNTLFVLTSDNGAEISLGGCNYPLRGTKGSQFEGNQRVIALIGGGYIPEQYEGTIRNALFSSLDWTPTLLHFAGSLNKINIIDYTWDGFDQYNLIMNNNDDINRDHIVFNIGLRNLQSATIVFKYKTDGHLYKYIAQDISVDQWAYKREDGWCVPEDNGDWNVIYNDDISLAQHVDNKYLFDLSNDIGEKTNLLQMTEEKDSNEKLAKYAKKLMKPYIEHVLYGEYLRFLWVRMPVGDPSQLGDGAFVAPFLTELEYFKHVSRGFSSLEDEFKEAAAEAKANGVKFDGKMPFTKALKGLYFQKWKPPTYVIENENSKNSKQNAILWYIYVIIAVVIVAFIIIVAVSIMKYRQYKNIYKDGYMPIKQKENNHNDVINVNGDKSNSAFVDISSS
eukprot:497160_1